MIAQKEDRLWALSVPSEEAAAQELVDLRSQGFDHVWGPELGPDTVEEIVSQAQELLA